MHDQNRAATTTAAVAWCAAAVAAIGLKRAVLIHARAMKQNPTAGAAAARTVR